MHIEQELKSNKYGVWQQLRINIHLSANWLTHLTKDFLEPYDITSKQYNILRILRGQKGSGLTILEVRDRMIDRMSDASRLIDRLSKKGLVFKCACTMDKRSNRVCITEKGLALLSEIDIKVEDLTGDFHLLDEAEAQTLTALRRLYFDNVRAKSEFYTLSLDGSLPICSG